MAQRLAQDAANHLVEDLRETHGENLVSVVIYGAATRAREAEVASNFNVLVVLTNISSKDLELARSPVREWKRIGYPAPSYFTLKELLDAADVFPIEFRKMERSRVVLFGQDPFQFVELSDSNLRHQTEYELRSKLLQLRRLYIDFLGSSQQMSQLLTDSLGSFATLFRPVLQLKGVEPPLGKVDTVRETVRQLHLDSQPFEKIFSLRTSTDKEWNDNELNELAGAYMSQIEKVIEFVNNLGA
jgi:hypothetical protein